MRSKKLFFFFPVKKNAKVVGGVKIVKKNAIVKMAPNVKHFMVNVFVKMAGKETGENKLKLLLFIKIIFCKKRIFFRCQIPCSDGFFGFHCIEKCNCPNGLCHHVTGTCLSTTTTTETETNDVTINTAEDERNFLKKTISKLDANVYNYEKKNNFLLIQDETKTETEITTTTTTEKMENSLINFTVYDYPVDYSSSTSYQFKNDESETEFRLNVKDDVTITNASETNSDEKLSSTSVSTDNTILLEGSTESFSSYSNKENETTTEEEFVESTTEYDEQSTEETIETTNVQPEESTTEIYFENSTTSQTTNATTIVDDDVVTSMKPFVQTDEKDLVENKTNDEKQTTTTESLEQTTTSNMFSTNFVQTDEKDVIENKTIDEKQTTESIEQTTTSNMFNGFTRESFSKNLTTNNLQPKQNNNQTTAGSKTNDISNNKNITTKQNGGAKEEEEEGGNTMIKNFGAIFRFIPSLSVLSGISILIIIIGVRWLMLDHKRKLKKMSVKKNEEIFNLQKYRESLFVGTYIIIIIHFFLFSLTVNLIRMSKRLFISYCRIRLFVCFS